MVRNKPTGPKAKRAKRAKGARPAEAPAPSAGPSNAPEPGPGTSASGLSDEDMRLLYHIISMPGDEVSLPSILLWLF